jgi:uncharacterized protein (TIGR00255 family)
MTGYAYREKSGEDISLSVEIKSYNNRYLEIYVNLPPWLSGLEKPVRDFLSSRCRRGKIEVTIRLKEHNAKISVSVNTEAARAYQEAFAGLCSELGINAVPDLSLLAGMEGILEVEKNRDNERYWKLLEPELEEAALAFDAERVREGKHTEEDILKHISSIESVLKTAEEYAPLLEKTIKENIKTRFEELAGNQIDENRILAETAVLLMKYTISEELSRLSSHLAEFRKETETNPSPGKKLDFLCQEINREINTIGSKSTVLELSRGVVEMKDALENIREQLRNVE